MSTNNLSTTPAYESKGLYSGDYPGVDTLPNTDLIYQPIHVYIEGVEVPFVSVSISQAMNSFPTCELEVPPQPGLMEIVRFYQPKIHIFYTDENRGGDRLLFWGHISAASYRKSRGSSSVGIHFRCNHRVKLANDILLFFGNPAQGDMLTTLPTGDVTAMTGDLSSPEAVTKALMGITGVATSDSDMLTPSNTKLIDADVTKLDPALAAFEKRLIGLPGALVNLWNQLKRYSCYDPNTHISMLSMYIPLFEQGVSYLKRISGHYLVEKAQEDSRVPYCPDGKAAVNMLLPHAFRDSSISAIQEATAVKAVQEAVGFSGEFTGFLELCEKFYDQILYEMVVLASPAEVNVDPTLKVGVTTKDLMAVETIIKPQTPFYYSPICNVIFPRMFDSIDISQEEESVPSRVTAQHSALPNNVTHIASNYRGPNSVREAMSLGRFYNSSLYKDSKTLLKYDLTETTSVDLGVPGKYEQGRGIHPIKINVPWWLVLLHKNAEAAKAGTESTKWPAMGTTEYQDMILQAKDWEQTYQYKPGSNGVPVKVDEKASLNPFNPKRNNIQAHEAIMFSSVDYEFSKTIAASRQGTVNCVFNPYIIPGYPMDVLDDSPNCPSFHGMCTSVTHTFTGSFIGTTVGMAAAMTYTEMSNYYMPPLHPWLKSTLGMINEVADTTPTFQQEGPYNYGDTSGVKNVVSTLLQNPKAKEKADEFYYSVLGVGSADPSTMFDYETGQLIPQQREGHLLVGSGAGDTRLPASNGGEMNPWLTTSGNLRLVSRSIEGKNSISSKFNYQFIDMVEDNYSGDTVLYSDPFLASGYLLEPGASMFLDYKETEDFVVPYLPPKT